MRRISIVGGGASGTLLAINLMRAAVEIEINLVDRLSRLGRGVAFGTTQASHLLNVPAGRMGALPDDIAGFHRWLTKEGCDYEANDFVPRHLYGRYLRDLLAQEAAAPRAGIRLNAIDDEAVDLSLYGDSAELKLRSGATLGADRVVLAFGNFDPPHPSVPDLAFTNSNRYFRNPWSRLLYQHIPESKAMFVVGTGLSMVDVALHVHASNLSSKITAISTRGLLPAVHSLGHTYDDFSHELRGMGRVTDMLRAVRRHIDNCEAAGGNWRGVIDSLRAATPQLWQGLALSEKRYFMQHLSRYWNVARHRMPPQAADILNQMQSERHLEILSGRLVEISTDLDGFAVTFDNGGNRRTVWADSLVNCIGSQADFSKIESEFLQNLLRRRCIRVDDLRQGLAASPDGRLVDRDGQYSRVVYTLGTALKGILWETTAIPEIRTQARALAQTLIE